MSIEKLPKFKNTQDAFDYGRSCTKEEAELLAIRYRNKLQIIHNLATDAQFDREAYEEFARTQKLSGQ